MQNQNSAYMTREQKGLEIAKTSHITKNEKGYWKVPSQSGHGYYLVNLNKHEPECSCPDCELRKLKCKHIFAVEFYLKREIDNKGNMTETKAVKITYSQNWEAYNKAQTSELRLFDVLLKDLVNNVEEPQYTFGRPKLSMKDSVFCSIQKVYSQLSQRRAYTLYKNAEEKEKIEHTPHFNAVGKLLNREDITPILHNLLTLTALPLKSVETTFAPDSSGFRTTQFNEYCKEKHGTGKHHIWVKAHILVGTKTNIVASARITEGEANDCPQFAPMVNEAHDNGFDIKEIPADKGYSSRENYSLAQSIGATAFIPFKSNATGKSRGSMIWGQMYHYFMYRHDEFLQHYHKRSNVESAFNMIKAKFGDKLRSKNKTAQQNELLCKLIAHNIVVLIHEIHELGIKAEF
jgi:transposase